MRKKYNKKINAYPTSFAQKRIYFLEKLEQGRIRNNIGAKSLFRQTFSVENIKKVIGLIVARHEALRSNFFETDDGELVQTVASKGKIDFNFFDLNALASEEKKVEEEKICQSAMNKDFDLSKDALVCFMVIKLSELEHELLVVAHHIIADAWSISIAANEFFYFSQALFYGQEPDLPPLSLQYKDYAAWEQGEEFSKKIAKQGEYWRDNLRGELPILEIPMDYSRPEKQSYEIDLISRVVNTKTHKAINNFCLENGITPYVFALGCYGLLLHKLSGQSDIIIGTFSANRDIPELDNVIGIFLNNLPIRFKIEKDERLCDYFGKIQDKILLDLENKDYPFEKLIEDLKPHRDLSRAPIFNTVFQLFNSGGHNDIKENIFSQQILDYSTFDKTLGKFDLSFHIHDRKNDWLLAWHYDKKLFSRNTIDRYLNYFENIIFNVIKFPDSVISRLEFISQEEKLSILDYSRGEKIKINYQLGIYGFFKKQALCTPDKIAIIDDNKNVCYQELVEKVDIVAGFFQSQGIEKGARIGFCLERSVDFLIALLAAMKIGAVYVPLDQQAPAERLSYIANDAELSFVLIDSDNTKKFFPEQKIIFKKEIFSTQKKCTTAFEGINAEETVAIIYTSGSTGRPKGVLISGKGVINQAFAKIKFLEINSDDVVLQNLASTFVAALWQFFSPLFAGSSLRIVPDETNCDIPRLIDELYLRQITVWETVPSLFAWFLNLAPSAEKFSACLKIILTGENTPEYLVRNYFQKYDFRLFNAYGQTECSDDTLMTQFDFSKNKRVLLGRPLLNTEVFILDSAQNLLPDLAIGEICIAGDGLSIGYNKLPEQTIRVFLTHPFSKEKMIYRTGDLGRRWHSGEIEYLGRSDKQFKLQGRRVEPGEIENCLSDLEKVQQSVAINHKQGLSIYYVSNEEVDKKTVYKFLKERLPAYMLPVYYVDLKNFPLNKNGKIDTGALPLPTEKFLVRNQMERPKTETELMIADIWQRLLPGRKIRRNDDFFALGGHSLLAVQLVYELHRAGYQISLAEVFSHGELSVLAVFLNDRFKSSLILPGGRPLTVIGDFLRSQQGELGISESETIFSSIILNSKSFQESLKIFPITFLRKNSINKLEKIDVDIEIVYEEKISRLKIIRPSGMNANEFAEILLVWQKSYNLSLLGENSLVYAPYCSYPEYYHCLHANILEMIMHSTGRIISANLAPAFDYFLVPSYCSFNKSERRDSDFNALFLGKSSLFMSAERFNLNFEVKKFSNQKKAAQFLADNQGGAMLLMGNNYFLPASPYYRDSKFVDSLLAGRNLLPMNYSIFQKNKEKIIVASANLNYFGEISQDDFWGYWKNFKDFPEKNNNPLDISFQCLIFSGLKNLPNLGLQECYEALALNVSEYFRACKLKGDLNSGFDKIVFGEGVWSEFINDIKNNIENKPVAVADITIVDMFKRMQKPSLFLKDLLSEIVVLNDDFVAELDRLSRLLSLSDKTFSRLNKYVKESKIDYEPIMTLLPSRLAREKKFIPLLLKKELICIIKIIQREQCGIFNSLQEKLNKLI